MASHCGTTPDNRQGFPTFLKRKSSPNSCRKPFAKKEFGTFKGLYRRSRYGRCRFTTGPYVLSVARQRNVVVRLLLQVKDVLARP